MPATPRRPDTALPTVLIAIGLVALGCARADLPMAPTDDARETHFIGICCEPIPRPLPGLPLTGAITTYALDGNVCAAEPTKDFSDPLAVHVNVAPGARLSAGWYYARVTDPSGKLLLGWNFTGGHAEGRVIPAGGNSLGCARAWHLVHTSDSEDADYGFNVSPTGVYKLWLSASPLFEPHLSLTTTFRIR